MNFFRDTKSLEDIAYEITGVVKLDSNTIILPNVGQISPRTIVANLLVTDENGNLKRKPLALNKINVGIEK